MMEILNMGGYAVFVWSAYFIALGFSAFLYRRSVQQLKFIEKQAIQNGIALEDKKVESFQNQSA
jgi:heme exporter protein D